MRAITTKFSTWLIIASLLLTTFTSQPTFAALIVHVVNVVILMLAVWVAHHEIVR